jgi:hypothetical protein
MFTVTGRFATFLIPLISGVLLSGGCTGGTVESTDEASPAASLAPTSDLTPTSTRAERGPLTGEELLWLQGVEQLLPKMNKVFVDSPTDMTPATLRSLANQARGCGRELARLGAASSRLQPVEALVRQACQEYDKGAKCFESAARLGTPSSSSEVRKLEQQINCGFAAAEKGGEPLAEAQIKAEEVRAAATGSG